MAKGFPDLIAIAKGFVAFLEIKDRTGRLSEDQVESLTFLHLAGFPVGCFRSVDTAIAFLRDAGAPL
jgi:hypothetical protein